MAEAAERDLATVAEDPDLATVQYDPASHAAPAVVVAAVGVGEQDRVVVVAEVVEQDRAVVVEQDQVEVADHRPAPVVVAAGVAAAVVADEDPDPE